MLSFNYGNAQDNYGTLIAKADSLYKIKDYKASNENYIAAFKLKPDNKTDLYNAA